MEHGGGRAVVTLGELDGHRSTRAAALARAFAEAGADARVSPSIVADLWRKFMFITSYAGVGALCRATVGQTREFGPTRELVREAMREVAALGRARGVELGDADVESAMARYDALDPAGTASLQRDLVDGKPSELADQHGSIVALARESGVPVPVSETVFRALSLVEVLGR